VSEVGVSYSHSGDHNLSSTVEYFDRFVSRFVVRSIFNAYDWLFIPIYFAMSLSFLIFDFKSQMFILKSDGIFRLVATLAALSAVSLL
jgi:uncharacterized membrane protein YqhA